MHHRGILGSKSGHKRQERENCKEGRAEEAKGRSRNVGSCFLPSRAFWSIHLGIAWKLTSSISPGFRLRGVFPRPPWGHRRGGTSCVQGRAQHGQRGEALG